MLRENQNISSTQARCSSQNVRRMTLKECLVYYEKIQVLKLNSERMKQKEEWDKQIPISGSRAIKESTIKTRIRVVANLKDILY